jgi:bifunctional non-homologous end joining protein LigD
MCFDSVSWHVLDIRRELLRTKVLSKLAELVRYSADLDVSLSDLIRSVRQQGPEGLVAKSRKSLYETGQRSGAWFKMRINQEREFVPHIAPRHRCAGSLHIES